VRPLAGQVAVVTGAGRGIGRNTALALARQGVAVAVGDVDGDAARRTALELGPAGLALELDVTDRGSFARALDEAEARLGPLDVLVNNAGIMPLGPFADEDDELARAIVDVNLHGVILGTKLALTRMLPRDRGAIVNLASVAGVFGFAEAATYSAAKHGVVGLTEAVRGELRNLGSGVRVSYVLPGLVHTELGAGARTVRLVPGVEPEQVARAIVRTLRRDRVDTWVPARAKPIVRLGALLPRPLADLVVRALRADRALAGVDPAQRRAHDARVALTSHGGHRAR
jgi:NAD(P)-dependent dehydrogenase (short-subunit alcohol dehydrogenase family)